MTRPWWQGAVFYEVYVRSFADSNDDGIGDLPGITSRLDYLKRLRADAVWLTPFSPSPQKGHGYDVANSLAVKPAYGTLEAVDSQLKRDPPLSLRRLVHRVCDHTSHQHRW